MTDKEKRSEAMKLSKKDEVIKCSRHWAIVWETDLLSRLNERHFTGL